MIEFIAITVLLFAYQAPTAQGLKCYSCTMQDPDCVTASGDKYLSATGPGSQPCTVCTTTYALAGGNEIPAARQCKITGASSNACEEKDMMGAKAKVCECDTDGCNGAPKSVTDAKKIKCYGCGSPDQDGCEDGDVDKKYLKDKDPSGIFTCTVCQKLVIERDGKTAIARTCRMGGKPSTNKCKVVAKMKLGNLEFKDVKTCECEKEGCNGASALTSFASVVVMALVAILCHV